MSLIIVDCEAPFGVGSPAVGDRTEFGAVQFAPDPPYWDDNAEALGRMLAGER